MCEPTVAVTLTDRVSSFLRDLRSLCGAHDARLGDDGSVTFLVPEVGEVIFHYLTADDTVASCEDEYREIRDIDPAALEVE
jgi:transcriptional/translational regulatory protein YebC/TACO1